MDLKAKLEKVKEKQAQLEQQLEAQAAAQNMAAAKVFASILSSSPGAYKHAHSPEAIESLSARERALFADWLKQIKAPSQTGSTQTAPGSTQTPVARSTH